MALKRTVLVALRTGAGLLLGVAGLTAAMAISEGTAGAASTYYVSPGGSGSTCSVSEPCSLSDALSQATGGTVLLATGDYQADCSSGADFDVTASVTLEGSLEGETLLDGQDACTVVESNPGRSGGVTLEDLSVVNGSGSSGSDGASGGGVYVASGSLTASETTFSSDGAGYDGGAIDSDDSETGATVSVIDSTFSGDGGFDGGAIDNGDNGGSGTLTVSNSTFSGDGALDGGAIDNGDNGGSGTLTVSNSTFSGDDAGFDGGAIDNGDDSGSATSSVSDSTFSGDEATYDGDAIDNGDYSGSGAVDVAADLFAESCDQAGGSWNDEGYNADVDGSCESGGPGDVSSPEVSSDLGSLAQNGGQTETIVPLAGDPAIDLISSSPTTVTLNGSSVELCPVTDQTGHLETGECSAGSVGPRKHYPVPTTTYYAAVDTSGLGNCADASDACSLTTALGEATSGDTIVLANGDYEGACDSGAVWDVTAPVTLEGSSEQGTLLDGENACTVINSDPASGGTVTIEDLTVENGSGSAGYESESGGGVAVSSGSLKVSQATFTDDSAEYDGGAIDSGDGIAGATVTVSHSAFSGDSVISGGGGAIDSGDEGGSGTLKVSNSTFSDDLANYGGAIDSGGYYGGSGTLTVSGSVFSNDGGGNDGGAIDNGDDGSGTATVSNSTFTDDSAPGESGGAIDNGDQGGSGTVSVSSSVFSGDSSLSGGAIGNDDDGYEGTGFGTLTVSDSTFTGNRGDENGGAIDNGDIGYTATLSVSDSTFSGNSSGYDGGAIDSGEESEETVTATVSNSTFSGNRSDFGSGDAIDNADNGGSGAIYAAGDLFADTCHQAGGSWNDEGYNAGVDGSCENGGVGDVSGAGVADLAPLADNGGATETMAPLAGNPATEFISAPTTVTLDGSSVELCPTTDQTGHTATTECNAGSVQPATYYAAPSASGLGTCLDGTDPCTLATALGEATSGDTIELANGDYQGTCDSGAVWDVTTSLTLEGSSENGTLLDGQGDCTVIGSDTGSSGNLTLEDLTVENGSGSAGYLDVSGGGVAVLSGSLNVSRVTFSGDRAADGGAIDFGDDSDGRTATVADSMFSDDMASGGGGAIDNGDNGGSGTLKVSDSTFSGDTTYIDGGAIANGDDQGSGTLKVSDSTFTGGTAYSNGGAIANGDDQGSGSLAVVDSTFSGDAAVSNGGAIDNGDYEGSATLSLSDSTFSGDRAYEGNGGAIANGDDQGSGSLAVADSTFSGDSAVHNGGAIDNGDYEGSATLSLSDSTFSGDRAYLGNGDAIDNADNGGSGVIYAAGDLFADSCYQAGGSWNDEGYNADVDGSCESGGPGDASSSEVSSDLGSLALDGGQTETIPPLTGNPAIGLVANPTTIDLDGSTVTLCPVKDQTGRKQEGSCDAGSVQFAEQEPLSLEVASSGTYGTPLPLSSSGGSGTGGVGYSVSGSDTAQCRVKKQTLIAAAAGTCDVTATKGADPDFEAASSSPTTVTFSEATPVVSLRATPKKSATALTPVTLVATVAGPSKAAAPSGTVTFYVGDSPIEACSSLPLAGSGSSSQATCDLGDLDGGSYSYSVSYDGDGNYQSASSTPLSYEVAYVAQARLTISTTSGTVGDPLSLEVSGGSDSGAVSYSIISGSCSLEDGVLSAPARTTCKLQATMAGNGTYAPVSSAVTKVTFLPAV